MSSRGNGWKIVLPIPLALLALLLTSHPSFAQAVAITQYNAKFLCGDAGPVVPRFALRPGIYATSLNIHNPNSVPVTLLKKAVLALPQGVTPQPPGEFQQEIIQSDFALGVDCLNIRALVPGGSSLPFFEGFVVIQIPSSSAPLDVVAVYTTSPHGVSAAPAGRGPSLEVVPILPTIPH